jgi:hypothetical protein
MAVGAGAASGEFEGTEASGSDDRVAGDVTAGWVADRTEGVAGSESVRALRWIPVEPVDTCAGPPNIGGGGAVTEG